MSKEQTALHIDINDYTLLEKQLQLRQLQVNSLLEVTQAINNNLSSDKLFRIYEFILRAQISVKKLVVYIKEDEDYYPICKYGLDKSYVDNELLEVAMQYKKLTFIDDIDAPDPLSDFDILVPVYHKEHPIAFAFLQKPMVNKFETLDEKIGFIQTITNIIVVAIENKRLFKRQLEQEKLKRELELAAQVQSLLIPKNLPDNELMEMAAVYLPHHDIGGDYYDYIELNEEEIIFCIADISGKGIAAAILMANFQAILRALVKKLSTFDDFVKSLNETVTEITKGEKFITLFVAKYNVKTRDLTYINAGHNPPVLLENGNILFLDIGCTILGMFEEMPFINKNTITLSPDTILINYTDGLTDLENDEGESFSLEKITEFISENSHLSMKNFNQQLLEEIMRFKGDRAYIDDISILSCRFK